MNNIFYTGSVKNQLKTKAMHLKWQERKQNPLLEKNQAEQSDPRVRQIKEFQEQNEKSEISSRISFIEAKMKSGSKITGSDLDFLKEHSPEMYAKAVAVIKEREEYRKALEKCETKDDVQRLNLHAVNKFGAEAKAVVQSSMPIEKKREQLTFIAMKMMAVQDEHFRFVGSDKYERLPREDEEDDERKTRRKPPQIEDLDVDKILNIINESLRSLDGEAATDGFSISSFSGRLAYGSDGQSRSVPQESDVNVQLMA